MRRVSLFTAAFLITVSAGTAYAWFWDRGLEARISEMRDMFRRRHLVRLFNECVDERVRREVLADVAEMRRDASNAGKIAQRLGFANRAEYLAADGNEVVSRFFNAMLHPPARRREALSNPHYLRLALYLSLIFAHLDEGMVVTRRSVSRNSARVGYAGNNFRMTVPYVYRNGAWYITRESPGEVK